MHSLRILLPALLLAACGLAVADEGHSHDGGTPAAAGPALPRFAATSEQFELVGVVEGRTLTLWLDRFDTNQPVPDARIELALGDAKPTVEARGDGVYRAMLNDAPAAGTTPVVATVVAGGQTDLLAGELDLHADTSHADAAHTHNLREALPWTVSALLVGAGFVWLARRRAAAGRRTEGGAA